MSSANCGLTVVNGLSNVAWRATYHRRLMANLINVERATLAHGTRTLLDAVSLGVDEGDAVGVVGRNGDGKTTLLGVLTRTSEPDAGRVTHISGLSVGYLRQTDDFSPTTSVRQLGHRSRSSESRPPTS